ncbi:helix-turn-helix domain-containing protein [Xylanimonas ulmi]|uniref:Homeodomain-like domain-containing protein n=1 Tax=Xylanimonas ulmi TaxID=228973 RepID=A0A4Q7LZG6_9MICO|nr:helix-turn-helix domain-containing protein [Xylanibacterium ulmi]RZS60815.1 hypothetical protein EV386_1095 [Xylanibacterium ulmi]
MSLSDLSARQSHTPDGPVRYRGRHLPMVAVVLAATIATALAYSGMVLFGLEVAHMSRIEAFGLAGFLEVSLVAVALLARNAALEGRPYGVLLTLTWILSGTSGMFAALHQIAVPDETTPYMVAFRFVPPLVAALMWHLALVGERHLVTGHTLEERRREHRVHQYVTALELWRDARVDSRGDSAGMRKVRTAHRRQIAARDSALRMLTVEDFEQRMQVWVERLETAERHGSRLDLIGATSAQRGVSAARHDDGVAPDHLAAVTDEAPVAPAPVEEAAVAGQRADDGEAADPASSEPFAEAFAQALAASDDPEVEVEVEVEVEGEGEARAAAPMATAEAWTEPLPETGHTRRVELFDLVRDADPLLGGAAAQRSAFFVAHGAVATPPTAGEVGAPRTVEVNADANAGANPQVEPEVGAGARARANDGASAEVVEGSAPREPERVAPAVSSAPSAVERDRLIRDLADQGLAQRDIAARVSASRATVSRVLRQRATAGESVGAVTP